MAKYHVHIEWKCCDSVNNQEAGILRMYYGSNNFEDKDPFFWSAFIFRDNRTYEIAGADKPFGKNAILKARMVKDSIIKDCIDRFNISPIILIDKAAGKGRTISKRDYKNA